MISINLKEKKKKNELLIIIAIQIKRIRRKCDVMHCILRFVIYEFFGLICSLIP